RPLVSTLWTQLSELGRTHGRAEPQCRSRHNLALGAALCSRTEPALSPRVANDQPFMAGGRNIPSRRGQVDLFISSSGFQRCDDRLSAVGHTGCGCCKALFPEGAAIT